MRGHNLLLYDLLIEDQVNMRLACLALMDAYSYQILKYRELYQMDGE
jgi:hypothetical protein